LLDVLEYISQEKPAAARRLVARIRACVRATGRNPRIGRMVPELETDRIRERIVSPYRIIYELRAEEIIVVAVLHERRHLSRDDEEPEPGKHREPDE
jgi:plasmid stabilization system protein ParE